METVFESKRINYVKVCESMVHDYLNMVNDDVHVGRFIGEPHEPFTVEQEREWIRAKIEANAPIFSMIEKSTGDFIGNVEMMDIKEDLGELGIAITAAKQEMGYGTEAINAFVQYIKETLSLKHIKLKVYPTNARAIHVYTKCGFREYDRNDKYISMELIL